MKEEKANQIVNLISKIAEGRATIVLNNFCDSAEKAINNTRITIENEHELVKLLTD